jgi:hypothetical protein
MIYDEASLQSDLWILTGQFREHLTEIYKEPRKGVMVDE